MDVKCPQCSAEYEFDESLLGEKGTTVKCSSCSHVFRVLPQRDATRPSLKLRRVRTGQVEVIGTLRDLQNKIHAGEVTIDDQLGRDGFPFRRLGDVPELKNFFATRVDAASSMRADSGTPNHNQQLRVSQTSMPPPNNQPPAGRPQGGRTVLGVGPQNPQVPSAPRVPNVVGSAPAPTAPRDPAQRFGSEAPTASRARPDLASLSQAPTVPGVSPSEMMAGGMGMTGHRPAAGMGPAPSNPVRLYLSDEEAPPQRATADGSRIWIYAIILAVLGGGAWLAMAALSKKDAPPVAPMARVETPAPNPAVLPTPEEAAAAPAQAASPTAPVESPKPSAPEPAAAAKPSEPSPAEAPEPAPAAAAREPEESSKGRDSEGSSNGAEPRDYSSWVARGDKAFQRGDLPAARKAYESALALRGTGSEANTGLGFTLLGEGKAGEAIPHFDRAAGSGYAEANIGLGDAYRRLGQKPAAIEAYKDYLERLPGGSKVSYVKRQLETLTGGGGGGESSKPAPEAEQPSAPPSEDYRPAGEIEQPAAEGSP